MVLSIQKISCFYTTAMNNPRRKLRNQFHLHQKEKKIPRTSQHSWQHYSKLPKGGNNLGFHQHKNRQSALYTYNGISLSNKIRKNFWYMLQNEWTSKTMLSEISQTQKDKNRMILPTWTTQTKDWANTTGELAGSGPGHPPPEAGRQAGDSQSWRERGKLGPRDSILYQTASRLPGANQVFLGSWTVDIRQEVRSQKSAPQRRRRAHLRQRSRCTSRKPSSWDLGGDKTHHTWGECTRQTPGCLSCSDLGRAQDAGPTASAPLWSPWEPEPEPLRPGKYTQPRAHLRQFPCQEQPGAWAV